MALCLALLCAGCGLDRDSAQAAVETSVKEFDEISVVALNVAPDDAAAIQDMIDLSEEDLASGDYRAAVARSRQVRQRTRMLSDSLPALQTRLSSRWETLSEVVPRAIQVLEQELLTNTDAAGLMARTQAQHATLELDEQRQRWTDAQIAVQEGQLAQAVELAEDARGRLVKLISELHVSP